MSRLFDDLVSDRLTNANAVITGYPFTLACWFNSDNIGISQVLMSVGDTATADNYHYLRAAGSVAGDPIQAGSAASGTARNAATGTGYSASTWHHACGVFAAAADRAAFIDGGSKGTNTQSTSPAGLDATAIGRLETSTPANHMSGMIAEAAIWDVALTDAEVALLAAGYSPLFVRPQNLVAYWPLIGRTSPEIDPIGKFEMTVTGAVVAAHPRIRYPVGLYAFSVAAGGGFTVTVNQASETDTAQAVSSLKVAELGQNSETDTAQTISAIKLVEVGQVIETDTSQAIAVAKSAAVAQVTESDTSQAISILKTLSVEQVSETDISQAVTAYKSQVVGQATEIDTVQAVAILKTVAVGQVTETDTAQVITAVGGNVTIGATVELVDYVFYTVELTDLALYNVGLGDDER